MVYTGGGVTCALEDAAQLGYCIHCTMFISSTHVFF